MRALKGPRPARAEVDEGAEGVGVRGGQARARGGEVPGEMREESGVRGEAGGEEEGGRRDSGSGGGAEEGAEEGGRHSGGIGLEGNPHWSLRLRWLLKDFRWHF